VCRDLYIDSRITNQTGFAGIALQNTDDWRVERCAMVRNGQNALQLGAGGANSKPCNSGKAVDVFAGRCANSGFLGAVSLFDQSDNNQFVRVEITESPLNNIGHAGFGLEFGADNDFINCHVHDIGDSPGFRMEGSSGGNNTGNRIVGGRWHGVKQAIKDAGDTDDADRNVARGMLIWDCSNEGLNLNATNWTVQDCVIDGRKSGSTPNQGLITRSGATGLRADNIRVYAAGEQGFQLNATDHELINCVAEGSQREGFLAAESGRIVDCNALNNGQDTGAQDFNRAGFEIDSPSGDYDVTDCSESGHPNGFGIVLSGTHSGDTRVTQNDAPNGIANPSKATTVSNNST
jgi:hypothetical protein